MNLLSNWYSFSRKIDTCYSDYCAYCDSSRLTAGQGPDEIDTTRGDQMLANYFQLRTAALEDRFLEGINSKEDWDGRTAIREAIARDAGTRSDANCTPLNATVTGTTDHEEFIVENVHFQSRPGLYVTGNLYVPGQRDEKLPAILYVCGHGRVKQDGVSYGNKVHYHHHGSWFVEQPCVLRSTHCS